MYKKKLEKQAAYRTLRANDKQLYHMRIDRRSMEDCRDSEADDMIDLGSDHRSIVTHFEFPGPKVRQQEWSGTKEFSLYKSNRKHLEGKRPP